MPGDDFHRFNYKISMKKPVISYLIVVFAFSQACSQQQESKVRMVGGPCDGCEQMFEGTPNGISWETKISQPGEPGERMIISGTIFKSDGKTPAPDIILYVYHTESKGLYSLGPNQTMGKRHGHLRGWMKTDAQGRYQFTSIRPVSYPNRKAPQHIHPLIKEPHTSLYWIDEYLFDDDPLLTKEERNKQEKRGGSGIIHLTRSEQGEWIGRRNIVLGRNVPNY